MTENSKTVENITWYQPERTGFDHFRHKNDISTLAILIILFEYSKFCMPSCDLNFLSKKKKKEAKRNYFLCFCIWFQLLEANDWTNSTYILLCIAEHQAFLCCINTPCVLHSFAFCCCFFFNLKIPHKH